MVPRTVLIMVPAMVPVIVLVMIPVMVPIMVLKIVAIMGPISGYNNGTYSGSNNKLCCHWLISHQTYKSSFQ